MLNSTGSRMSLAAFGAHGLRGTATPQTEIHQYLPMLSSCTNEARKVSNAAHVLLVDTEP